MATRRDANPVNTDENIVYVSTNFKTSAIVTATLTDTVSHIKDKVLAEHKNAYPLFGEIQITALLVKRSGKLYKMPDCSIVSQFFNKSKANWCLVAVCSKASDASGCLDTAVRVGKKRKRHGKKSQNDGNNSVGERNQKVGSGDNSGTPQSVVEPDRKRRKRKEKSKEAVKIQSLTDLEVGTRKGGRNSDGNNQEEGVSVVEQNQKVGSVDNNGTPQSVVEPGSKKRKSKKKSKKAVKIQSLTDLEVATRKGGSNSDGNNQEEGVTVVEQNQKVGSVDNSGTPDSKKRKSKKKSKKAVKIQSLTELEVATRKGESNQEPCMAGAAEKSDALVSNKRKEDNALENARVDTFVAGKSENEFSQNDQANHSESPSVNELNPLAMNHGDPIENASAHGLKKRRKIKKGRTFEESEEHVNMVNEPAVVTNDNEMADTFVAGNSENGLSHNDQANLSEPPSTKEPNPLAINYGDPIENASAYGLKNKKKIKKGETAEKSEEHVKTVNEPAVVTGDREMADAFMTEKSENGLSQNDQANHSESPSTKEPNPSANPIENASTHGRTTKKKIKKSESAENSEEHVKMVNEPAVVTEDREMADAFMTEKSENGLSQNDQANHSESPSTKEPNPSANPIENASTHGRTTKKKKKKSESAENSEEHVKMVNEPAVVTDDREMADAFMTEKSENGLSQNDQANHSDSPSTKEPNPSPIIHGDPIENASAHGRTKGKKIKKGETAEKSEKHVKMVNEPAVVTDDHEIDFRLHFVHEKIQPKDASDDNVKVASQSNKEMETGSNIKKDELPSMSALSDLPNTLRSSDKQDSENKSSLKEGAREMVAASSHSVNTNMSLTEMSLERSETFPSSKQVKKQGLVLGANTKMAMKSPQEKNLLIRPHTRIQDSKNSIADKMMLMKTPEMKKALTKSGSLFKDKSFSTNKITLMKTPARKTLFTGSVFQDNGFEDDVGDNGRTVTSDATTDDSSDSSSESDDSEGENEMSHNLNGFDDRKGRSDNGMLMMRKILRNSAQFKKAKLIASQTETEPDELNLTSLPKP